MRCHWYPINTVYRTRFKTKDKNDIYKQRTSKGGKAIIVLDKNLIWNCLQYKDNYGLDRRPLSLSLIKAEGFDTRRFKHAQRVFYSLFRVINDEDCIYKNNTMRLHSVSLTNPSGVLSRHDVGCFFYVGGNTVIELLSSSKLFIRSVIILTCRYKLNTSFFIVFMVPCKILPHHILLVLYTPMQDAVEAMKFECEALFQSK